MCGVGRGCGGCQCLGLGLGFRRGLGGGGGLGGLLFQRHHGSRGLGVSREAKEPKEATRVPCRVAIVELKEGMRLVVVNKHSTDVQTVETDVAAGLDVLRSEFLADYYHFLLVRAATHITMISYAHTFPGLVHFLFVDRSRNVVTAPAITPETAEMLGLGPNVHVLGRKTDKGASGADAVLHHRVWELVFKAQRYLSSGYTGMSVRDGQVTYSYRLWVEDESGREETIALPLPGHETPFDCSFYKDLTRALFPSAKPGTIECFELYTLHVGVVSAQTIAAQNRRLVASLREAAM